VQTVVQEGDAYAFGVMLYELYCSKPAWANLSTGEIISAKLRSHAGESLQLVPDAPPALQVLVCLSLAVSVPVCFCAHDAVHVARLNQLCVLCGSGCA